MRFPVGLALIGAAWLAGSAAYAQDEPAPATAKTIQITDIAGPAPEESKGSYLNTIVVQGLNKVTGHISKLDAPVGTVVRFDNLEIIARRCWKANPEERPENAALLDVWELKPNESPQQIFLGWMFSSSPGLSGIEHPVYDVTVLACENRDQRKE